MVIRLARFNTYLLATALLATLAGCETTGNKREKQIAKIRLHVEVSRDAGDRSEPVLISRSAQVPINVDKNPFLHEGQVTKARLVDAPGGFKISIQFDQRGTWLLEQYSAMNPGKHLAIAAQFGEKLKEARWLAAPLINHRISDGALAFTPDTTREEAEEIVRGLNNGAIKSGNQPKPKKDKAKDK
jgi:preprotein translocase subunit SecD